MSDFVSQHGGWFAFAALVVTILGFAYGVYRDRLDYAAKDLADPRRCAALCSGKADRLADAYFGAVGWLVDTADGFYGRRKLGWPAFDRALLLAFLYPILFALLAWVAANVHSPGGLALFADIDTFGGRLWRGMLVVGGWALIFITFRNLERIEGAFRQILTPLKKTVDQRAGFLAKAARWSLDLAPSVLAFAVAFAGAFAFAGAVTFAGAFAGAGAVTFAGAFAFAVTFIEDYETAALLLFFYALLPLANGLSDFASVAATRRFLGSIQTRPGWFGIVWRLVVDLVFGALCLLALLWLVTLGSGPIDFRSVT